MQLPDDSPRAHGKILSHDAGIGEPGPEGVEKRARELAEIAGFAPYEVTDAHRAQARLELLGEVDPTIANDDDGLIHDLVAANDSIEESGIEGAKPRTEEDESVGEMLYAEGVEEAAHDQMTQSRHEEQREAGY